MKLFSLLTALLTVAAMQAPVANAAFSDIVNSPYKTAIDYVKSQGIVEGYQDGTYRPNDAITRAAFSKIVVESLDVTLEAGSNCFSDIPAKEWYATYVCTAKTLGIVSGNPGGTFDPAASINYAAAAKIVVEANGIDTAATSIWYERYLSALESRNATLSGVNPESNISRGQMAQLIYALANNAGDKTMDDDKMMKDEDHMMDDDTMMDKTANIVDLADVSLTDGTEKVLFFNATWCPTCVSTIKMLEGLSDTTSFTYPAVLVDFDTETSLRAEYGVTTQHTFVLVDGQGNEIQKWVGPSDAEVTELLTK